MIYPVRRQTLALCLLVKNEQENLPAVLASVAPACDEIIVVDNGSTDSTKAIAEANGARVIDAPGPGFDKLRNYYVRAATSDWLLVLDADELLLDRDVSRVRDLIQRTDHSIAGYALPRHDFLGRGRWANVRMLRLFRRLPGVSYEDNEIHSSPWQGLKRFGRIDVHTYLPIQHLDVVTARHAHKRERYTHSLESSIAAGHGNRAANVYLAAEYAAAGDMARALSLTHAQLSRSRPTARDAMYLGHILQAGGHLDSAWLLASRAQKLDARFREPARTLMANVLISRADYHAAQTLLLEELQDNPFSPSVHINLASIALTLDEQQRAGAHLDAALDLNPLLLDRRIWDAPATVGIFGLQDAVLTSADDALERLRLRCVGKDTQ